MQKKIFNFGFCVFLLWWLNACEQGSRTSGHVSQNSARIQNQDPNHTFSITESSSISIEIPAFHSPLLSAQDATSGIYVGLYSPNKRYTIRYDISDWQLVNVSSEPPLPILVNTEDNQCQLLLWFPAGNASPLGTTYLGQREWRVWQGSAEHVVYVTSITNELAKNIEETKMFAVTLFDNYRITNKSSCQQQAEVVMATFKPDM